MAFSASRLRLGLVALAITATTSAAFPAQAQIGSPDRYAAIVTEARSGAVLFAANADEQRYPASLTKMMTVYMAFEGLRDGRFQRSTPVPVSATAASMPPSRLGLAPGMTLTVEEAILALVTKSANDAAAALGEFMGGGSEQRFAQMMTMRARQLGMTRTTFRNASGLPDYDQVTTARDMALLGRRLIQDFPREYAYFSTPHFVFRGRTHWNHNRLLQEYEGTDGIKTGYVNDSGFNLVASAQRDGVRLVAAVFGGRTGRERDRHMMAILDRGFVLSGVAIREREPVAVAAARPVLPRVLASARAATPARPSGTTLAARNGARPLAAAATTAARTARATPALASSRNGTLATRPTAPMLLRTSATVRSAATATRIEQGDTGGRSTVRRTAATPTRAATATAPARSRK